MRITIFVAVAVCLVGVCAHAEPSGITTKLPCSLSAGRSEVATERHLEGQETVQDDEERVGTSTVESAVNELKSTFGPAHIKEWLITKKSTADVVKLLALDKAENVLRHPNFAVLGNFVKQFNLANPESRTSLIKVLTTHYGESGVFKIIKAAKQVPDTARLARRLQEEQLQYWLSAKRPKDVFAIMELDKAGKRLFKKPEVITWVKYLDQFNKEYSGKPGPVSLLFLKGKKSEKTFVRMLIAAKEVQSTEELAVRVQAELTLLWLRQQKPPAKIFKYLNLNKADVNLFDSPLFAAWMKYVDDYNLNQKDGQIADVYEILKRWYPIKKLEEMPIDMFKSRSFESLAMVMKDRVQKEWFKKQHQTPEDVLKDMVDVDPLEGSTLLRALEDYPRYFQNHQIHQTDYDNKVNTLKKHFKETKDLVKMVLDASMNPVTKSSASKLMDVLLKQWAHESVEPYTVSKWLRVENTAADNDAKQLNDITKQLNKKYSEMYDEYRNTRPAKRLKITRSKRLIH